MVVLVILDRLGDHRRRHVPHGRRCHRLLSLQSHYRGCTTNDAHQPFEIATGERYRQEKIRKEQLKPGAAGKGAAIVTGADRAVDLADCGTTCQGFFKGEILFDDIPGSFTAPMRASSRSSRPAWFYLATRRTCAAWCDTHRSRALALVPRGRARLAGRIARARLDRRSQPAFGDVEVINDDSVRVSRA